MLERDGPVGNAFATEEAREEVLMEIDESVDAVLAKVLNQVCHDFQVGRVVEAFARFYSRPHDTETH